MVAMQFTNKLIKQLAYGKGIAVGCGLLLAVITNANADPAAPQPAVKAGRVALVQYTSDANFGTFGVDDAGFKKAIDTNRKHLTQLFHESVKRGANIIIFPEGSSLGYQRHASKNVTDWDRQITWCAPDQVDTVYRFRKDLNCFDPTPYTDAVPGGETTNYWQNLARKAGVYLVVPTLEKIVENGKTRFANTAIVLGPQGYITKHRKTARWENEEYLNTIMGTGPTIVETPYGKFGVIICSGIFTQGLAEAYVAAKVDAVLFPSDWVEKYFAGYQGDATDNSFNFLSTWKGINLFSADDARSAPGTTGSFYLGSGRTGFFSKDATIANIKMPDKLGKDGILLLNIDFSKAPKSQVKFHSRILVSAAMDIESEN